MKENVVDNCIIFDEVSGTYRVDPEQAVRDDVEKHQWKHIGKTILKDWRLYLMLVPMLLVFFFWRYLPMYELLGAFKNTVSGRPVAEQSFVGFRYFQQLLSGSSAGQFWQAFRNTFMLSFYGLLFGFPMPIVLALFFNEIKSNIARSFMQVATYLPKFMSTVVVTTILTLMLRGQTVGISYGILSKFLMEVGIITEQMAIDGVLSQPQYFRAIYEISGIWETAGYDSIVFFAAIIAVSPTNYEAAQIDGAGKMAQMRYVVIPSILSTVVIMLIMRLGSMLSVGFEKVLLLSNMYTYVTAQTVSTYAIFLGTVNSGLASAAEMMNNIIGMILVIGANAIARKATDVSLY